MFWKTQQNTECEQRQQTKRYLHEGFRGCFSNGNEILLKYNFSLVKQSYADRGFVLFFANHRNLEVTLKPSGYGEFEEKLRKRKFQIATGDEET